MYRPTKRKLVRRVSLASAVGAMAVTGLGLALIGQSGATTALKVERSTSAAVSTTAKGPSSTLTISPKYHVVSTRHHDDGASSQFQGGDN